MFDYVEVPSDTHDDQVKIWDCLLHHYALGDMVPSVFGGTYSILLNSCSAPRMFLIIKDNIWRNSPRRPFRATQWSISGEGVWMTQTHLSQLHKPLLPAEVGDWFQITWGGVVCTHPAVRSHVVRDTKNRRRRQP